MTAKHILATVYEKMYPEKVAELRRIRQEKKAAMQAMLDACRSMRENGYSREIINRRLSDAYDMYTRGQHGTAANWAEMESRKPTWTIKA